MAEDKKYYFCLFMESETSFDSNLQFIENMREWWGHSVIYKDSKIFIEQIKQTNPKRYTFVLHYLCGIKDLEAHMLKTFITEVGVANKSVEYVHHHILKDKHELEKYLHKNSFRDYFSPIHEFYIK